MSRPTGFAEHKLPLELYRLDRPFVGGKTVLEKLKRSQIDLCPIQLCIPCMSKDDPAYTPFPASVSSPLWHSLSWMLNSLCAQQHTAGPEHGKAQCAKRGRQEVSEDKRLYKAMGYSQGARPLQNQEAEQGGSGLPR